MELWAREPINDVLWHTLLRLQVRSTAWWTKQTRAEMWFSVMGYGTSHLLHLLKENNNANLPQGRIKMSNLMSLESALRTWNGRYYKAPGQCFPQRIVQMNLNGSKYPCAFSLYGTSMTYQDLFRPMFYFSSMRREIQWLHRKNKWNPKAFLHGQIFLSKFYLLHFPCSNKTTAAVAITVSIYKPY